ncbi:methylase, partial [bacterium]|nr:methylase [bacterium]MBP5591415.1 methylase [bacterium]
MAKTTINRKKAAKEFADFWKNKGDERQETARFWIGLLEKVLGMENPAERIEFEKKVQLKHTSFIDAYIPETKVLIEQKSSDVDLRKEAKQSDGAMLTPYRQAKRYADEMPNSLRPNWIVVCNFQEFQIYDMEKPQGEPVQVLLEDLPDKFECLQ